MAKDSYKERSAKIIAWLNDHPLINRHALCRAVGYDTSNLLKVKNGKLSITDKFIDRFEKELASYGYYKKKPAKE